MSLAAPPSERLLTGLEGFLTLANDPTQIRAFYDLHKGLEDTAPMRSFEQTMLAVPEIAQMVDEAWEPPHLTLAELSRMPEGSLGRAYAQRMLADGLDPDVIRRNAAAAALEPGESDLARKARYLTRRRTMTHDIHHTVTGFGTDLPGEVGVSAVYLAQIHQPVSLLYLCAVLLHTMSHETYTLYQPVELAEDNKRLFKQILDAFLQRYQFELPNIFAPPAAKKVAAAAAARH
jgi:ubiquinone biosynthesis protein COQ4